MHWNVLSDFRAKATLKQSIEPYILDWSNRSFLIQEHIKSVDPDIIGLCDVDGGSRNKFLSNSICSLGYQEYHKDNTKLGVSIFFKSEQFTLINSNFYPYEKKQAAKKKKQPDEDASFSEEYFIYVHLQYKLNPEKELFFVETHLNQQMNQQEEEKKYKLM